MGDNNSPKKGSGDASLPLADLSINAYAAFNQGENIFDKPQLPPYVSRNQYSMQIFNNGFHSFQPLISPRMNNNYRLMNNSMCSASFTSNSRSNTDVNISCPPFVGRNEKRYSASSYEDIVEHDLIEVYARDKHGCQYLQDCFPPEGLLRDALYSLLMRKPGSFKSLAMDVFANFYAQILVVHAKTPERINWITKTIVSAAKDLCFNRYACRVIQKVLEHFPTASKIEIFNEIIKHNVSGMANDQNANHVIQKIIENLEAKIWCRLLDVYLADQEVFFRVMENKFGCRIMQQAVEYLSKAYENPETKYVAIVCLENFMHLIIENCERLSCNEYANFVVQHVIKLDNLMVYRNKIIENCLLRNLLSLSQEKFASHVVEKALKCASPNYLFMMLEEIFDGYMPDPTTKKECLDILLFHQYGNYVMQHMLELCFNQLAEARMGKHVLYLEHYKRWSKRLKDLITANHAALTRYSSGKKLISVLESYGAFFPYLDSLPK